jgi:nitrite reductase/ring-hydroxylating ferredoxin subunit
MTNRLPLGTELARLEQLPEGATCGLMFGEGDAPLRAFAVRMGDVVHVYVNRCPHAGRQLNAMPDRFLTPDGELIQCVAHGALFEKATGECIAGPCVGDYLKRIEVVVKNGVVCSATELDLARLSRAPWS